MSDIHQPIGEFVESAISEVIDLLSEDSPQIDNAAVRLDAIIGEIRAEREAMSAKIDEAWLESHGAEVVTGWRADLGDVRECQIEASRRVKLLSVDVGGVWQVDIEVDRTCYVTLGRASTRGEWLGFFNAMKGATE